MELINNFVDLFLHLDKHLSMVIQTYGSLTYIILFLIIFCETGLVITPLLPGDSLLFAAGAMAATGALNIKILLVLLFCAPLIGDQVNYWVGRFFGSQLFFKEDARFLKKAYIDKTHGFYNKYGGKTIIIARFVPIVRTFAPFVAGLGKMNYLRFIAFSVVGALMWVGAFVLVGFFFGNIPIVKNNFTLAIMAIIGISLLPAIFEYVRQKTLIKKTIARKQAAQVKEL
ncbi:MAG: DedA family protein [Candidatus Margulisiibacteriota bacterium]|nr:MAG: hypothetical protein A2X43_04920 [Candidatus Margulisbacteria bacterium GWD2_39_127]OGI03616.1 MAG: hypothetical protein A2X42_01135 [Candidatus Margulisbacteria bacterium GWF2_38_17]OGI11120.1 MAG: hypothetical protein A2X41_02430 [Candidatus Margulisbacteria bacterium GWE2_39_32]PZM78131.1 MAG: DedA family protein [Candidatus Margulisiibacteriota bacterium]HAR64371.1 DedA family protein [Candidatus Margulisiibacteriota bacterium]